MADGFIESLEQVEKYLANIRYILCSDNFDVEKDIDIILSTVAGTTGRKNFDTIGDLSYTKTDIKNALLSLTSSDYSETLPDIKDASAPLLYVFGKTVKDKELYIKVKIRNRTTRQVFCLSFHYAEYPTKKPYSEEGI